MLNMTMTRWVQREGNVVEFGNVVGSFVGKTYRYVLPDEATAATFEEHASRIENGAPCAIAEQWHQYRA